MVRKGICTLKIDSAINPLDKLPSILNKNLDQNLCVCNEVLKMDIINAISQPAISAHNLR